MIVMIEPKLLYIICATRSLSGGMVFFIKDNILYKDWQHKQDVFATVPYRGSNPHDWILSALANEIGGWLDVVDQ